MELERLLEGMLPFVALGGLFHYMWRYKKKADNATNELKKLQRQNYLLSPEKNLVMNQTSPIRKAVAVPKPIIDLYGSSTRGSNPSKTKSLYATPSNIRMNISKTL